MEKLYLINVFICVNIVSSSLNVKKGYVCYSKNKIIEKPLLLISEDEFELVTRKIIPHDINSDVAIYKLDVNTYVYLPRDFIKDIIIVRFKCDIVIVYPIELLTNLNFNFFRSILNQDIFFNFDELLEYRKIYEHTFFFKTLTGKTLPTEVICSKEDAIAYNNKFSPRH